MNSIKEIIEKIKGIEKVLGQKDIFTAIIIILASLLSFGLGRLSVADEFRMPVRVEQAAGAADLSGEANISAAPTEGYVASKNGSKYHYPWCPGAEKIKKENRILFSSKKEAEAAGFSPAANCKGL